MDDLKITQQEQLNGFRVEEDLGEVCVSVSVTSKPYLVNEEQDIRSYCDSVITLHHKDKEIERRKTRLPYFHLTDENVPLELMCQYVKSIGSNAILGYTRSADQLGYECVLKEVEETGRLNFDYKGRAVRLHEKLLHQIIGAIKLGVSPGKARDDDALVTTAAIMT